MSGERGSVLILLAGSGDSLEELAGLQQSLSEENEVCSAPTSSPCPAAS
jgi:hypothetical protein